jgi:hypothetical protein
MSIVFNPRFSPRALSALMLGGAAACVLAGTASPTQEASAVKPPTPAITEAAPGAPATKAEALAFLAGSWSGEMGGSPVEEMWSRPLGPSIMGCFRWCKPDSSPAMFEMLAITEEKNDAGEAVLRLRLHHFTAALVPHGDATKPMTLRLTESGPARAVFTAEKDAEDLETITYEVADGHLRIDVAMKGKNALNFRLKKQ